MCAHSSTVEHRAYTSTVLGSNPSAHTKKFFHIPPRFYVRILARALILARHIIYGSSTPIDYYLCLCGDLTFLEKFVRIGSIFNKIIERTKDDAF
ncbi:MAG: hypothetical protein UX27_C0015G0007 [Candidatus Azambacteria bacterium GW2011_GWA2_45_90]|uniref:Uncharacterized protein n=1 Tax=Candidatus Azambacteria bacterium GW2011_GWA2_45_90 TaxID=1618614 RepID=A0A0G1NEZ0_9BACT|nr:MAG: hypothetical protein UX27_C0015G0007 [Candidatus Azambacteria bacterium GW2011_GWA2_45_90]